MYNHVYVLYDIEMSPIFMIPVCDEANNKDEWTESDASCITVYTLLPALQPPDGQGQDHYRLWGLVWL